MAGTRRGARSVMKWFAGLYAILIVVQVFLAGEGIFGLNTIKNSDDCDKKGGVAAHLAQCSGNSKALDPHRALGFFLTFPGAILFLIVALLAWHPVSRIRIVSIVLPFLAFVQMILPGAGRWVAALHPVNAILLLGLFGWLFYALRNEQEAAPASLAAPTG
ncbi:MAG TPA: hypothetical protein VLJ44_06830 [Gaiellaceae bacterium]|nr:hypothetical protein [Gaiellaceae bacterium]